MQENNELAKFLTLTIIAFIDTDPIFGYIQEIIRPFLIGKTIVECPD